MAVYYVNLALLLLLAWPLCIYKPSAPKKIIYLVITLGYMWFLAAFRYGIGFDYYSYVLIFRQVRNTQGLSALLALPYEPGFVLLTKVMTLFVKNSIVMYGVYELLILLPVGWFVYKYCKDAWFSLWLFVTLTFYYTTMNFVRQALATSIILLAYRFLRDKKPVPYFLIVLVAASFHKTALIMVPVYFLCRIKFTKKTALFYAIGALAAYLASEPILNLVTTYIFPAYKDSIYTTPFPLVFLLVPFLIFGACLALLPLWRKRVPEEADILLNLMLYSAVIWLFITKHFILERFSHYVYIFVILALPQAVACLRRPQEDYDRLAELRSEGKKGPKTKAETAAVKTLAQNISDHQKYYWSAVVAVLLLTLMYSEFGQHVNGFHAVFPYHSEIEALDAPGINEQVDIPEGWVDFRE